MNVLVAIKRVKSATTNHRTAIGGSDISALLSPKLTVLTTAWCRRRWSLVFLLQYIARLVVLRQYVVYYRSVVCF